MSLLLQASLSLLVVLPLLCRELKPAQARKRSLPLKVSCAKRLENCTSLLLTNTATDLNGSIEQPAPEPKTEAPAMAAEPAAKAPSAPTESPAADGAPQDAKEAIADESATGTNGATATKKTSSEKRKSTSVPEHKGKKLNKKKSAAKITHLDAQPGEHYFARLKSYPPWPAIVCDEEILPETLRNTRPVTTKKADGTYNEAYADGGKKVNERTFAVMFLGTNEL
jgi:hypothetical protein